MVVAADGVAGPVLPAWNQVLVVPQTAAYSSCPPLAAVDRCDDDQPVARQVLAAVPPAGRPTGWHATAEHRVVEAVVHSSHSAQADKHSTHSFEAAAAAGNKAAWAAVAPNSCSLVAERSWVAAAVDADTAAFAAAEALGDGSQLGAC